MSVFSTFCGSLPRFLLALGILLAGCGGAQGTSSRSADDAGASDEGGSPEGSADGEATHASDPGPRGPDCSDGTCFACGDGMCPVGFFCDEQASGGPACGWLPECADAASCSCVLEVLGSSCSCDDESGGPRVNCD